MYIYIYHSRRTPLNPFNQVERNGGWSKRGFGQAWYLVKKRDFLKGPFLLFSVVMFSDSTVARLLRNRVEGEGNCAVRFCLVPGLAGSGSAGSGSDSSSAGSGSACSS